MFPLFELSRLLSFGPDSKTNSDVAPQVALCAWKEVGERSLLALLFSNGYLVLRHAVHGCTPVIRQLPWYPDKPIQAMTFDPTGSWLLCVTSQENLCIVPVLALLAPKSGVDQLWKLDDITKVKYGKRKGTPTCVAWWTTFEAENVAVVGTKLGFVVLVNLLTSRIVAETDVNEHVSSIDLVQDDSQSVTYALITTKSNSQWRLFLEMKVTEKEYDSDEELTQLGFETVDTHSFPIHSIIKQTEITAQEFLPLRFYQFPSSIMLAPQCAKGLHLVAAHDLKNSIYQIYDSSIEHSPLFVFRVPERAENIILTDKLIFFTSAEESSSGNKVTHRLTIASTQMAEAAKETVQEFNPEALVQHFQFPQEENILAVFKHSFPFYWHEKREEEAHVKKFVNSQPDSALQETTDHLTFVGQYQIASHTVLDGCIIITNQSVYQCRPRISPERLFLQLALEQGENAPAEHLAFILSLDINALYLQVAQLYLAKGDVSLGYKFFQLAKCPHIKRVASFAKYGRIAEVLTYLQQTLNSKSRDLGVTERRELSNLTLYCFVQQILQNQMKNKQLNQMLRTFLQNNHYFTEKKAIKLLAAHRMDDILIEFAKSRGLVVETLEALLQPGHMSLGVEFSQHLIQKGYSTQIGTLITGPILSYLVPKQLVFVMTQKPQMASQLITLLRHQLSDLSVNILHQMALFFDPSKSTFQALVSKVKGTSRKKRSLSISSLTSGLSSSSEAPDGSTEETDGITISDLINLFLEIVICLNSKTGLPQELNWDFMVPREVQLQAAELDCQKPYYQVLLQCQPIDLGPDHLAVICDGDLYTSGATKHGRLGHGEPEDDNVWVLLQVESLIQVKVMSVACGGQHTLVLTDSGVYGWGNSQFGQVGNGTTSSYSRPVFLETLSDGSTVALACGHYHSMALTRQGQLYTWGWGVYGQLGNRSADDHHIPTHIPAADTLQVTNIAAGYSHSLLLTIQGDVYAFGSSAFGQLGNGSTTKCSYPVKVPHLPDNVTSITTRLFHNFALTGDGELYQWGAHPHMLRYAVQSHRRSRYSSQGGTAVKQAENVQLNSHLKPSLVDISAVNQPISQVFCGSTFQIVVTIDGEVYSWGKNFDGQLGIGNRIEQKDPVMITKINDKQIVHLACGAESVVAMDIEGILWAWGRNNHGQLGIPMPAILPAGGGGLPGASRSLRQALRVTELVSPTKIDAIPKLSMPHDNDSISSSEASWSFPLPPLGGTDDVYSINCILSILQHMWEYVSAPRLLRVSQDASAWQVAAWVCLHQRHHAQALYYHLRALHNQYNSSATQELKSESHNCSLEQILSEEDEKSTQPKNKETEDESTNISPDKEDCAADKSDRIDEGSDSKEVEEEEYGVQLVKSTITLASFYLRKIAAEKNDNPTRTTANIQNFLVELCDFWWVHSLPTEALEKFVTEHLKILAADFFILLARNNKQKSVDKDNESYTGPLQQIDKVLSIPTKFWDQFSPKFHVTLTLFVIESVHEGRLSKQQIGAIVDKQIEAATSGTKEVSTDMPIAADKLWQEILQNIHKDLDTRSHINLTTNQVEVLKSGINLLQAAEPFGFGHGSDHQMAPHSEDAVLFTCGHHFIKETFTGTILSEFEDRLSGADMSQSASLFNAYYKRREIHPMACPNCVLQAIKAM